VAFRPSRCQIGPHRVQAAINPCNERSLGLAQRVGFRREGFAPRMLEINGMWEDRVIFGKLVDEHQTDSISRIER